jgi:hypothetical protein
MSNLDQNTAVNSAQTEETSVKSGYLNVVKRGWGRLLRVREVQAKRSRDLPTLHAFIAFDDGDGVDCIVSGEEAKVWVKDLMASANAPAPKAAPGEKQLQFAHYVDMAVEVSDCFSTTFENKAGKTIAGRKGRLLKVHQVVIDGVNAFDDNKETFQQAQTTGGGYLRNVRQYSRDGKRIDCVTVQFAHGKTGELQWDAHQLDVLDPAVLEIVKRFEGVANAKNPEAKNNDKAKPYLDCHSVLKTDKDGEPYVLRNGVLLGIKSVKVNGVLEYNTYVTPAADEKVALATPSEAAAENDAQAADEAVVLAYEHQLEAAQAADMVADELVY